MNGTNNTLPAIALALGIALWAALVATLASRQAVLVASRKGAITPS